MTNEEAKRFMAEHFLFVTVPMVPVTNKMVTFYTVCYGCGAPMLDGDEYKPEFCSEKCYCETACIDRKDG